MPDKKSFSTIWMAVIIVLVLILDQVSKYIIKTSMYLGESFPVWGNFFRITYVENPGMAFGFRFSNSTLFMVLSIVAGILVLYYLYRIRNESWILQLALSWITAGAIGNLLDRFIYGRVVDFLDFEFWDISVSSFDVLGFHFPGYAMTRWPVFNVADMAVSGGMIILIAYILFVGDPIKQVPKKSTETPHVSN